MRLNVICFAGGVIWLQQQPALPTTGSVCILAVLIIIFLVAALILVWPEPVRRSILAAAFGIGGFVVAGLAAHSRLADALPPGWEGRDIVVIGVVATLPHYNGRRYRFEFDVDDVLTPSASVPRRIVLSWWGARNSSYAAVSRSAPIRAGERWQLKVRLRRPHGTVNPHGFDYERWLFERGLRASGYVRRAALNRRIAPLVHRPRYWIERGREVARGRIMSALSDAPHAGVIAALVIGDQRAIPREQWRVFTRTGVNHLMSISGLHITMVSGLVFAIVYALWRLPALTLRIPARKAAAVVSLLAAFGYALLTGFAVPAQRTVFMLTVVAAALWLGTVESPAIVLASAVFVVLLLDPWAVLAPGFWLSFGAVAAIMYVSCGRIGHYHPLAAFGRVQVAVTLALVPLLLAMFRQVSIVSPIANALAIPVVSLVVVPMSLAGTFLPLDFLLWLADTTLGGCLFVLSHLSDSAAAVWMQPVPPFWTLMLAIAATLLLLAPRGFPGRWLGVLGLAPMFLAGPSAIEPGAVQIAALDVGHGTAILVRTATHALLYDTGPSFGPSADSGSRIVVPYLRAVGVQRLDRVILSHDDDSHTGGTVSVLQGVRVRSLMTSLHDRHPITQLHDRSLRCQAGQHWEWDGVSFDVVHPTRQSYTDPRIKENDRSCVLKIESPHLRVLLPGDIERRSENALLASVSDRLRADVLLAPRRGSRSSSSDRLIAVVRPRVVIFSVGHRNRFRHPHPEVVGRYLQHDSQVFRTDRDGAVLIDAGPGRPLRVTSSRRLFRRYWYEAPVRVTFPADPPNHRGRISNTPTVENARPKKAAARSRVLTNP